MHDNGFARYSVSDNRKIFKNNNLETCKFPREFEIMDFDITKYHSGHILGALLIKHNKKYIAIVNEKTKATLLVKEITALNPWKIQFADVDDDGISEVCLGVYKTSPLHKVMAKRRFIYNFHEGLQSKWLAL